MKATAPHPEQCICVSCERRKMPNVLPCAPGENCTLAQLEAYHIKLTLEKGVSLTEAANILGIDAATLYRKRRRARA